MDDDSGGGGGGASTYLPLEQSSGNNGSMALDHYAIAATNQQIQSNQNLGQETLSLLAQTIFYSPNSASQSLLAIILILLIFATAVGNVFVIKAICTEKNLRGVGNWLVLSLAIADLLVACLVMTMAGIYLMLDRWTMGVFLCDIWTSADVFCCTASILHLLAIALDRYWAVTRVDYIRCQRNKRRIVHMIVFVWLAAAVISLAPAFGWKDAEFEWRITKDQECLLSQDIGYQIFATCTTFYFPLTLTLIFYWKIYQVARKRIRRKPGNRVKIALQQPSSSSSANSSPLAAAASASASNKQQRHFPSNSNNNNKSTPPAQRCHKSIVECSRSGGFKSSILKQGERQQGETFHSLCLCSCHNPPPVTTPQKAAITASNKQKPQPLKAHEEDDDDDDDVGAPPEGQHLATPGESPSIHLADNSPEGPHTIEKTTLSWATTRSSQADTNLTQCSGKESDSRVRQLSIDAGSSETKRLNNLQTSCGGTCSSSSTRTSTTSSSKDNPISETADGGESGEKNLTTNADNLIYATKRTTGDENGLQISFAKSFDGEAQSVDGESDEVRNSTLSCCRSNGLSATIGTGGGQDTVCGIGESERQNEMTNVFELAKSSSSSSSFDGNNPRKVPGSNGDNSTNTCKGCEWTKNSLDRQQKSLVNQQKQASFCSLASCSPASSLANGFACDAKVAKGTTNAKESNCCGCCCDTNFENSSRTARHLAEFEAHSGGSGGGGSSKQAPQRAERLQFISDSSKIAQPPNQTTTKSSDIQVKLAKGSNGSVSELVAPPPSKNFSWMFSPGKCGRPPLLTICWHRLVNLIRGCQLEQVGAGTRALICDSQSQDEVGEVAVPSVVVISREQCNNLPPLTSILSKRAAKLAAAGQCKMCNCELIDHHGAINGHEANSSEQGQPVTMAMAPASTAHIAIKTSVRLESSSPTTLDTTTAAASSSTAQRQSTAPGSGTGAATGSGASNEGLESKRERKAAKTLAIITGVFVMCWLPFFVMAIAMPLLDLKPHKYLFATLQWLGYANSMLNPIIYTIFSPDFRVAFKRMLCGSTWSRNDQRQKEANRFAAGSCSGGGRKATCKPPTQTSANSATNCVTSYDTSSSRAGNFAPTTSVHQMIAHFWNCCCCRCASMPNVLSSAKQDKDRTITTLASDRTINHNNNNHHFAINCSPDKPAKCTTINLSPKLHGGGITNDF